jgi:hypothetical protein
MCQAVRCVVLHVVVVEKVKQQAGGAVASAVAVIWGSHQPASGMAGTLVHIRHLA